MNGIWVHITENGNEIIGLCDKITLMPDGENRILYFYWNDGEYRTVSIKNQPLLRKTFEAIRRKIATGGKYIYLDVDGFREGKYEALNALDN